AWCLMPNHVHLILVPQDEDGLRRVLARVHRRYAGMIHARRRRTGHFWQGRYGAVAMDEDHLAAAYRYVNLNPVRGRLVRRAEDRPWSSARALLGLAEDGLTDLAPARQRCADLLEAGEDEGATARLTQRRERRPAGRFGCVPRRAGNQDPPPPPRPQARAQARGRRSDRDCEVNCRVTGTPVTGTPLGRSSGNEGRL